MQMTMTFSFDNPNEASVFFGEMSALLTRTGSALAGLFKPTAAPTAAIPQTVPAASVPQQIDQGSDAAAPAADEPVGEAAAEPKRGRGRPKVPKKIDALDDALGALGSAKTEAPAAEMSKAKPNVTIELLRELVDRVVKKGGKPQAQKVFDELKDYGVAKLADLKQDQMQELWVKLRKLDVDDEIPY